MVEAVTSDFIPLSILLPNRLILGSAKIASYFRTPMITIGREQRHCDWRGEGLASAFKPHLDHR